MKYSILKNLVHGSIVLGTKFKKVFTDRGKFFLHENNGKKLLFSKKLSHGSIVRGQNLAR